MKNVSFEMMQILASRDDGWKCIGMDAGQCIAWQDVVHKVSAEIPRASARVDETTIEVSHEHV